MKSCLLLLLTIFVAVHYQSLANTRSFQVVNGDFENGLTAWQVTGDVHLTTNSPMQGKASVSIGPGAGSLAQRVETGSGNDFTLSAIVKSQRTNGWLFAIRFLDQNGREVMKVDSVNDIKRDDKDPLKLAHYMKAHPLTKWIEIVVSKDSLPGSVVVNQVDLQMTDENAAEVKPVCDLDQAMQPFWLGKKVSREAVLMQSTGGNPACGQLMFRPSRIISVQDYGATTNFSEGTDYTVKGRTLFCPAASRMTQVRDEDLLKGEFKWNTVGGKQVMVTYEHDDDWEHPCPAFVGNNLPHTLEKLKARAPVRIIAYGDSITHGVGASRLSHIRPYLPPWPELVAFRLTEIFQDAQIQLFNSAQSGADSEWAAKYADPMVASLNPDLVIVAFGQNDFWRVPADTFASNIRSVIQIVRKKNPHAEFLLVSTMRFDPAYTTNAQYSNLVGDYSAKLKSMSGPGIQCVDMTAISECVYAAKKPMDCVNDPLHPNDYLARWYAQTVVAALDPSATRSSMPTLDARSGK